MAFNSKYNGSYQGLYSGPYGRGIRDLPDSAHQWFIEESAGLFHGYIELSAIGSLTPRDDIQALYVTADSTILANDSLIGSGVRTVTAFGLSVDLTWDEEGDAWQGANSAFEDAVRAAVNTTVPVTISIIGV